MAHLERMISELKSAFDARISILEQRMTTVVQRQGDLAAQIEELGVDHRALRSEHEGLDQTVSHILDGIPLDDDPDQEEEGTDGVVDQQC